MKNYMEFLALQFFSYFILCSSVLKFILALYANFSPSLKCPHNFHSMCVFIRVKNQLSDACQARGQILSVCTKISPFHAITKAIYS